MSAKVRIYQQLYNLEQSGKGIASYCTKHLGMRTKGEFNIFYRAYELWRMSLHNHREAVMRQKEETQERYRQAFGPKQA
jgi:hypothetical protein